MKTWKLLLALPIIFCLCFAGSIQHYQAQVIKMKKAAAGGWSDTFTDCTGNDSLDGRTGWDTVSYDSAGGTSYPDVNECQNQQVERLTESNVGIYTLATYSDFADADYCVEADVSFESDSTGSAFILIRAARDGENDLNGYAFRVNVGSDASTIYEFNTSGTGSVVDTAGLPVVDWATPQTLKICISTAGSDCTIVGYINDTPVTDLSYTDSACTWTANGLGGIMTHWLADRDLFIDNFAIIE